MCSHKMVRKKVTGKLIRRWKKRLPRTPKLPMPSLLKNQRRNPIPSPSPKTDHAAMAHVTGMEVAMATIAVPAATIIVVRVAMAIIVTASTVAVVRQTVGQLIMAKAVVAGAAMKDTRGTTLVANMPVEIMAAGNMTGITVTGTVAGAADSIAVMAIMPAGSIPDIIGVTSLLIGVNADMAVAVDTNMVTTLADVITVIGATSLPITADADRTTVIMPTDIIAAMTLLTAVDGDMKVAAGTVIMQADVITVIEATNSPTVADAGIITVISPTAGTAAIVGTSSLIAADEGTTAMDTTATNTDTNTDTNTATTPAAGITVTADMSLLIADMAATMDIMDTNSPIAAVTAASDMVPITSATMPMGLLITADGDAAAEVSVI